MKQLQVLSLFAAGALILTNPSKEEYLGWVKEQAALSGADGALFSLIGLPLVGAITTTENCWFFSVYTTALDGKNTYRTIGLFHSFLPIPLQNAKWTPGARYSTSQHVLATNEQGKWRPEDGYAWVVQPPEGGDFRVNWSVGRKSELHPHLVTAATEGQWLPEDGYVWVVPPPNGGDPLVRWVANRQSAIHPHVATAAAEGRWFPEDGYTWAANPPQDGDFRVISLPSNQPETRDHVIAGTLQKKLEALAKLSEMGLGSGAQLVRPPIQVTANQAKASCSIVGGRLFCPSPGSGLCWAAGHSPYHDQTPNAIDISADDSSPNYNHPERCSEVYSQAE